MAAVPPSSDAPSAASRRDGGATDDLVAANNLFPFYLSGEVVKGFGRGSKELGVPTANFPSPVVDSLPPELACGVYCGFARVSSGPVYPMVMSVGWNDFYKNTKRSAEVHILHAFDNDFYGEEMRAAVTHYIRPMRDFRSVDELIHAIREDIAFAKTTLATPEFAAVAGDKFFFRGSAGDENPLST